MHHDCLIGDAIERHRRSSGRHYRKDNKQQHRQRTRHGNERSFALRKQEIDQGKGKRKNAVRKSNEIGEVA